MGKRGRGGPGKGERGRGKPTRRGERKRWLQEKTREEEY